MPTLAERQQQFRRAVPAIGVVRRGDVVNLDYLPGRGMTMTRQRHACAAPRCRATTSTPRCCASSSANVRSTQALKAGLLGQRPPG